MSLLPAPSSHASGSSSTYSASSSVRPTTLAQAIAELREWRENPSDEAVNKRVQQVCLDCLLSQDDPHWFCDRSPSELIDSEEKAQLYEVATFCVRLVGFKATGKVAEWKSRIDNLLSTCCGCVEGWLRACDEVDDKYLRRRWAEDVVRNWHTSLLGKERQRIKDALETFDPADQSRLLPVALVYHILIEHAMYSQPDILSLLAERVQLIPLKAQDWPTDLSIPPGLLFLQVHKTSKLRNWAVRAMAFFAPISRAAWDEPASQVPKTVVEILETLAKRDRSIKSGVQASLDSASLAAQMATDQKAFWSGLYHVLARLEPDILRIYFSGGGDKIDIVRMIAGHLGDRGDHWLDVLRCFRLLLDKLGQDAWRNVLDRKGKGRATLDVDGEIDLGYVGARLHDALDNDYLTATLHAVPKLSTSEQAAQLKALFGWIEPFLTSLKTSYLFSPVFAIILGRLLAEYGQKTHYEDLIQAKSVQTAMQACLSLFGLPPADRASSESTEQLDQAVPELDRHVALIAKAAFDRTLATSEVWRDASQSARAFVAAMAARDAQSIRKYVAALTEARKSLSAKPDKDGNSPSWQLPHLGTCEALLLASVQPMQFAPSVEGAASLARALSSISHLAKLSSRSWLAGKVEEKDKRLKAGVKTANEALDSFFKPVCAVLRIMADEDPAVIKQMLHSEGAGEAVTILILSPTEDIANAAQSLVRQAFDVSSRLDCFRALFQDIPEATLRGVITALRTFKDSAQRLPEACGQAKRLVRCLTDVINVLCDPTEHLIRDEKWVEKHNAQTLVSRMWNLMCADIAIIFDKTEQWSVMFENEEMTDWMRDAVIFLQEMLDDLRTFEAAASGNGLQDSQDPTPRKMSSRGREMVNSLNEPFGKLVSWFRLNDRDLLTQTAEVSLRLIERFTKARIPINPEVVKRLRKLADKAKDPKARKDLLLRPETVLRLIGALAKHPDYAEEFAKTVQEEEAKRNRLLQSAITVDSDDDVDLKVAGSKSTKPIIKPGSKPSLPTKLIGVPSKSKTSNSSIAASVSKMSAGQAKPSARYRTAPSTMKNAIYSHAAMKAAQAGSSSDEGDWSDKDPKKPSGLAKLAEAAKKYAAPQPASAAPRQGDPRKVKMLDGQDSDGRSRVVRRGNRIMTAAEVQAQNQNKARMRYNPDYTDLHRQILQWNVAQLGPLPAANFRYPRNIPSSFDTAEQYISTFLPLLLLECWNEILTAMEELNSGTSETPQLACRLAGRAAVDDFVEIAMSLDRMPDRQPVSESDIVLLRGPVDALGKIHQVSRKQQKTDIVIRCHLGSDNGAISRGLTLGTQWNIIRLFTLSTAHREYAALMSLPYYDLLDEILAPPHKGLPDLPDNLVERAMKAYRCNKPQAGAIISALSSHGFSLIQGPPGTGKTKTILGLVGAFISNRGRRAHHTGSGSQHGEKLLLCAPSNAAVDEVAKRLKEGVYDSEGKKFTPKVVRIGADTSVNVSVNDIFLDTLVEKMLAGANGQTTSGEAQSNIAAARTELVALREERDRKREERNGVTTGNTALMSKLQDELSKLTSRINSLGDKMDRERDKLTQSNRAIDSMKRKARADILGDADVICATLSGSGHDYLANYDFETVIIDEAAQSVEISSLIPLKYNCQRCIMVGDPNQLPPTVKSREATNAGYNKSLFVRLHAAAPEATHLLSIQYRMHPDISSFPSKAFYESRLSDGPDMATVTKQPWHTSSSLFPPYAFLHVKGGKEERGRHHSLMNSQEAAVAVALYSRLVQECKGIDLSFRVGVITAYKAQVGELRKQFRQRFGEDILSKIDFNTVDGFQGQEKDIIILSCVRGGAGEGGGIGFLSDVRRMNVALTRARSSLFILGDSRALRTNESWGKLVEDATERGALREVDKSSFVLNAQAAEFKPQGKKAAAPPAAKRTAISPSKQILPAPPGLMTPAELAKARLGTSSNGSASSASSAIGAKRRLIDGVKKEEEDDTALPPARKRSKIGNGAVSNAAPGLLKKQPTVKREELEDGEIGAEIPYLSGNESDGKMQGVEYTAKPNGLNGVQSLAMQASLSAASSDGGSASGAQRSGQPQGSGNGQTQPSRPAGAPTLVPPKRPAVSSMFIPRKRPGAGMARPGQR